MSSFNVIGTSLSIPWHDRISSAVQSWQRCCSLLFSSREATSLGKTSDSLRHPVLSCLALGLKYWDLSDYEKCLPGKQEQGQTLESWIIHKGHSFSLAGTWLPPYVALSADWGLVLLRGNAPQCSTEEHYGESQCLGRELWRVGGLLPEPEWSSPLGWL